MAKKVYLHVGLPKSGTSYLQAVFAENKNRLRERAGILYPGATWADQVLATRDLLNANPHGARESAVAGAWQRLVDEIHEFDGDSLVSMEWLSSAEPVHVRRLVETLAPAQVEVVVTIRDLGRTIPAAWQEFMQNWEQWTWDEFLGAVTSDTPRATPAGNMFWSQQDLGRLLVIWTEVLPPEQIHVVPVGQAGATAADLWLRFASVMSVDGTSFDTSGRGSNESLGLESAELMLRLNQVSRTGGLEWPVYNEMFKNTLAKRGLSKRKHRERRLYLPAELEPWARARTAEHLRAIEASGVSVVGDLDDLDPRFTAEHDDSPVDDAALLDAALEGLVALAKDRGEELARLRARIARLRDPHGREDGSEPRARLDHALAHPLRFVLVAWSEKHPSLMTARVTYRRLVNVVRPPA